MGELLALVERALAERQATKAMYEQHAAAFVETTSKAPAQQDTGALPEHPRPGASALVERTHESIGDERNEQRPPGAAFSASARQKQALTANEKRRVEERLADEISPPPLVEQAAALPAYHRCPCGCRLLPEGMTHHGMIPARPVPCRYCGRDAWVDAEGYCGVCGPACAAAVDQALESNTACPGCGQALDSYDCCWSCKLRLCQQCHAPMPKPLAIHCDDCLAVRFAALQHR